MADGDGYQGWGGVGGNSAPGQEPAAGPGMPPTDGRPMTSFPPAETGFFPPNQHASAAGFQAPPMAEPEPRLLLGAPPPANPGPDKRRRTLLIGASAIAVVGVTAGAIALSGGGDDKKQPVAAATTPAPVDNSAPGSAPNREGQSLPGAPAATSAAGTTAPPAAGSKSSSASSSASKSQSPASSSSSSAPAPAPAPAPNADLLHWRLGEAAGTTAADTSGRNLAGTAAGAATFAPSVHGGSVAFTGPAGQIKGGEVATKGPVIDTTKSFTISMWIDQTGITTPTKYAAAFSQDGPQNFAFTFSYSTDAKTWSFVRADNDSANPTSIGVGAKTPVPLNSWHQLTGVYDAPGGTISFYVDGVPQGTAKAGSAPYAAGGPFAIGRSWYQKYPSNPFNGYISDVRVYGRALSAAEVKGI